MWKFPDLANLRDHHNHSIEREQRKLQGPVNVTVTEHQRVHSEKETYKWPGKSFLFRPVETSMPPYRGETL